MINTYHNAIRDLVATAIRKGKTGTIVRHYVGVDEVYDPTLIAFRVYNNWQDADVIMICAGTNAIWQPLPERVIFLPTPMQLFVLKKKYNQFDNHLVG